MSISRRLVLPYTPNPYEITGFVGIRTIRGIARDGQKTELLPGSNRSYPEVAGHRGKKERDVTVCHTGNPRTGSHAFGSDLLLSYVVLEFEQGKDQ
eukprot:1371399-Amorphochlora_amoeboformis.AAC.1